MNPATVVIERYRPGVIRGLVRLLMVGLILWLGLAWWAVRVLAAPAPSCAQPSSFTATSAALQVGSTVRSLAVAPPKTETIVQQTRDTLAVAVTQFHAFAAGLRGAPPPADVTAYEQASATHTALVVNATLACAPSSYCPGSGLPAGSFTGSALAQAANAAAGFTGQDLVIMTAIDGAESGYVPTATHRNSNGSTDYGLAQINSVHAGILASGPWADPYANARMARQVWAEAGGSWRPWATYNSGSYLKFMPKAGPGIVTVAAVTPAASAVCSQDGRPIGTSTDPHLTGATAAMRDAVNAAFPGHTVGCYRAESARGGEHPLGRACDVMVSSRAQGDAVAAWAQARPGVLYVLWWQRIWSPARASEGWRGMADRGSPTENHLDHVHVSMACVPGDPPWSGCTGTA